MKGIGILSVIIGHYWGPFMISYFIFSFHMPLFVLISGYLMKTGFNKQKVYKLAKGYLIPYVITWLINLVLLSIKNLVKGMSFPYVMTKGIFYYVLSGLYAVGSNSAPFKPENIQKVGVIWFLMALFWGQVIFLFIMKITKDKRKQIAVILMLWIVSAFLTSYYCVPLGLTNGVAFTLYLYLGYQARENDVIKCSNKLYGLSFFIWVLAVCVEFVTKRRFSIAELHLYLYGLEILGALAGTMVVLFIALRLQKTSIGSKLALIGEKTIWILCVHGIDIEVFSGLFERIRLIFERGGIIIDGLIVMAIRLCMDVGIGMMADCIWSKRKWRDHS